MKKALAPLVLAALLVTGCNTQTSHNKGKDGKELVASTPQKVAIDRNATTDLKVTVDRSKGFEDPVTVKITGLPEGVVVEEEGNLDKGVKERVFKLKATSEAPLTSGKLKVVVAGGGAEKTHEVAYEVRERSDSASSPAGKQAAEDFQKKRDELNTTLQARMKDIDKSMGDLREQAKTADAQAKVEINSRLSVLEKQRQKLGEDMKTLPTTTAEAWQDFSTRVSSAANDLHKGVNEAVQKFKKK